jgi:hypothetical protein
LSCCLPTSLLSLSLSLEIPAVWRLSSTPVLSFTAWLGWPGEHEAGITCRGQHIPGSCHCPIDHSLGNFATGLSLELPPNSHVSTDSDGFKRSTSSLQKTRLHLQFPIDY